MKGVMQKIQQNRIVIERADWGSIGYFKGLKK